MISSPYLPSEDLGTVWPVALPRESPGCTRGVSVGPSNGGNVSSDRTPRQSIEWQVSSKPGGDRSGQSSQPFWQARVDHSGRRTF